MDLDLNVLAPLGTLTAGLLTIAGTFAKSAMASFERIAAVLPPIEVELRLGREERLDLRRQLETERAAYDQARREADLVAQIGELGETVSDMRIEQMAIAIKALVARRRASESSDRPSPPPPDSDPLAPAGLAPPAAAPSPPSRPAPRSVRR